MTIPAFGEWQRIATAPKDGTEVLLFSPNVCFPGVFRGACVEFEGDPNPAEWLDQNDIAVPNPTHWMPLPPPPADEVPA